MHRILALWATPRSTSTAFEWMMRMRGDMECFHEPFVEAYCRATGIPFKPEALGWQPGARHEVSWYDGGSWHQNLRDSDGLKPQPRAYIDIAEAPERVREIYDIVLPHYRHLHRHRLTAPTPSD